MVNPETVAILMLGGQPGKDLLEPGLVSSIHRVDALVGNINKEFRSTQIMALIIQQWEVRNPGKSGLL